MKKILFVFVIFFISLNLYSQNMFGEVTLIQGKGYLLKDNKKELLSVGDKVYSSDIIETDTNSNIEITLINNKGVISIKENSKVGMSSFNTGSNTNFSLSLKHGIVQSKVNKENQEYFNCTTSSVTAGVRGTDFTACVAPNGEVYIEVDEGKVSVSDLDKEDKRNKIDDDTSNEIMVTKDQYIEKDFDKDITIKESSKEQVDYNSWIISRKLDLARINTVVTKLDIKVGLLVKKIQLVQSENKTLTKLRSNLRNTYKDIIDRAKAKNVEGMDKKSNLYSKMKESFNKLNVRRLNAIHKGRIIIDEYRATYDLLTRAIDNGLASDVLDEAKKSKFNDILRKINQNNSLVSTLEQEWLEFIYTYNEDEEILSSL